MISRAVWSGWFRVAGFWILAAGVIAACDAALSPLDVQMNLQVAQQAISDAMAGNGDAAADAISRPAFAVSLALLLGAAGVGLLAAYLLMHGFMVRLSIAMLTRTVRGYQNRKAFADSYESVVYPRLHRHPLVGHAWKEFDETLLKDDRAIDGIIGNTVRPQSFVNYGLIKDRLTGLKILGSISGYFVGVGLLLTFIGIVLALGTAGEAAMTQSTEAMKGSMIHLLEIASFKFTTSIAGLGVSIVFAIVAKLIVVWIEGGFTRFCDAVEHQLRYTAPQSITAEMNEVAKEQRDQLKELNSDRYFSRLAEHLELAMKNAIAPMSDGVGAAVQQSAGKELRQLGETLERLQSSLSGIQVGIQGTGEDFSRRMSEAAENLNRLVGEAGSRLEGGAEQSRTALQEVVEALKGTFERANTRLDADLGTAAAGASLKVEDAMSRVMERFETQMGGFMTALSEFQSTSAKSLTSTQDHVASAQSAAATAVGQAGSEAAKALQEGMVEVMRSISNEVGRLEQAMRSGAVAYASQTNAIGDATNQTRSVADALAQTAEQVRGAAAPLLQTSQRMAEASVEMSEAISRGSAEIQKASEGSSELAQTLTNQIDRLGAMWEGYKEQFERVDESLAQAVDDLGKSTEEQSIRLAAITREMDGELAKILDRLRPAIQQIGDNTEDIADSVEKLSRLHLVEAAE